MFHFISKMSITRTLCVILVLYGYITYINGISFLLLCGYFPYSMGGCVACLILYVIN